MWKDFFKLPTDEIPYDYDDFKKKIKDGFLTWKYYKVYDFIDWVVRVSSPTDISSFINHSNKILERENSGYRFVGNHLTSITDKKEIKEIETVMQVSDKLGLTGVKSHIECALQLLSDRENPDYKNSFKESISAVEAICKKIIGKPNATLGDALKLIDIHTALKKGYSSIYGYTSSADGIRHGSIDISKVDYDDAKYMLVSCSAFVNYLIIKAQKAGMFKPSE